MKDEIRKSRIIYVILALFLGALGIHNFYAGRTTQAIVQLLITLLIGWLILPLFVVFIWVLVDICAVDRDSMGVPFD